MVSHRSKYAYAVGKWFDVQPLAESCEKEPVFCFQRFGRAKTKFPDGRIVYIANFGWEHKDFTSPSST